MTNNDPQRMSMEPLVAELVRAGAEVKGRAVKCPWHDDRHASGSIYQGDDGAWRFKCQVCGAGGDVYDLRAKIDGKPLADVLREAHLAMPSKATMPSGKRRAATIYATLDDAQAAALAQMQAKARDDGLDPAGVKFSERWQYTAKFFIVRFDLPETDPDTGKRRKSFRPLSRNLSGWSVADLQGLLPLYGIDKLPPTGPVFFCEGERKVDALRRIGLHAVTSAHGAKSPEKSDWRPLKGREAIGLPDNDDSGTKYVDKVGRIVTRLSPPATVSVLTLPDLPPKGDIVDFLGPDGPMDGKTADQCRERILELAKNATPWATLAPTIAGDWPEPRPLPTELPPVLAFDYSRLPEALRPWIQDIAERTQCPPDFPAVGVTVALAGIVGRKIAIRPKKHDDWTVVPNVWGAVIGRPGIMKTPALRQPLRPLQRLEIEAKERFDQEAKEYEAAKLVADLTRKEREGEVRKAIRDGGDALAIATEILSEETSGPVRRRYLVNDSSVEKLGELLNENPNGLTVYRDELVGLLRSLDREGQESARAFYLEAWDGAGRFTYDRIGRGTIDIEAATVSIIGGIQPGRLAEYLRAAVKGGEDDDGLASPVAHLTGLNAKADRRKVRRALAVEEIRWLLDVTRQGPNRYGMSGTERALLYRLALETGLRSNELRTLTRSSFALDGDKPTVVVEAAYSKHRREDVLPLRADTAADLRNSMAVKLPGVRAFNMPTDRHDSAEMFRQDMDGARLAWLDRATTPQERQVRERSSVLLSPDGTGRVVDFHGLRHTCGSLLAAAQVHPKVAQSIMRHCDINLTMSRYTHVYAGQEVAAVAALPDLDAAPAKQSGRATGTDDAKATQDVIGDLASAPITARQYVQVASAKADSVLADCLAQTVRFHPNSLDSVRPASSDARSGEIPCIMRESSIESAPQLCCAGVAELADAQDSKS